MTQPPPIVTDEALQLPTDSLPSTWVSRRLYWSEAGAMNWLAVVNEATYTLRDPNKFNLRDNYLAALSSHSSRTLVSLGPGDGRLDLELMSALRRPRTPAPRYIPVDISRRLLEQAIANVEAEAAIPVGICCDFEDGMGFLAETLKAQAERPLLFALLGGTVGNLDNGEEPFFDDIRRQMHHGDAFLIDFPLAGPGWNVTIEPRLNVDEYTPKFRHFLAEGARLADAAGREPDRVGDVEQLKDSFADWASFLHEQDAITGAEVLTITDRRSGRRVLVFRRYHWEPLLHWLEQRGFVIEFAKSSIGSEQVAFGMGVVLLAATKLSEQT